MLVVSLGASLGARAGEKGGIRGTKTEGTSRVGNALTQEKGCCIRIDQHLRPPSKGIMANKIKS